MKKKANEKRPFRSSEIASATAFIDISNSTCESLLFLKRMTNAISLDASNTEIESLNGVCQQKNLFSINLTGTPFAQNSYYKLMSLIVFGSSLKKIDGKLASPSDIENATLLRPKIQDFITQGWILLGLNPVKIRKGDEVRTINFSLNQKADPKGRKKAKPKPKTNHSQTKAKQEIILDKVLKSTIRKNTQNKESSSTPIKKKSTKAAQKPSIRSKSPEIESPKQEQKPITQTVSRPVLSLSSAETIINCPLAVNYFNTSTQTDEPEDELFVPVVLSSSPKLPPRITPQSSTQSLSACSSDFLPTNLSAAARTLNQIWAKSDPKKQDESRKSHIPIFHRDTISANNGSFEEEDDDDDILMESQKLISNSPIFSHVTSTDEDENNFFVKTRSFEIEEEEDAPEPRDCSPTPSILEFDANASSPAIQIVSEIKEQVNTEESDSVKYKPLIIDDDETEESELMVPKINSPKPEPYHIPQFRMSDDDDEKSEISEMFKSPAPVPKVVEVHNDDEDDPTDYITPQPRQWAPYPEVKELTIEQIKSFVDPNASIFDGLSD